MMYVFVRDACDALIATAPRRLRYQLIYNDMRLNFCSRDLDSVARAVMLASIEIIAIDLALHLLLLDYTPKAD